MANQQAELQEQSGTRIFLKGAITIIALLLLGYFVKSLNFEELFKSIGFEQGQSKGQITFLVLAVGLICVGAPRQIISFFAAFFFGLYFGFLLAWAATTCGCVISYSLGRVFNGYFKEFVKGKLDIALTFWRENTFSTTVIWRFLPVGNNLITNLAAGAFKIPAARFVSGSALGYVPQTAVFAILGSGVNLASGTQISISIILFGISAAMGLYLFSRYRKRMKAEA